MQSPLTANTCHLLWKVSIANAWFLSEVCISQWACCWCRSCLRRLATSSCPSERGMGELALNISVRTLCWTQLEIASHVSCLHRKPLDGGSAAFATWLAGAMSLAKFITCYAVADQNQVLYDAVSVTEPWQRWFNMDEYNYSPIQIEVMLATSRVFFDASRAGCLSPYGCGKSWHPIIHEHVGKEAQYTQSGTSYVYIHDRNQVVSCWQLSSSMVLSDWTAGWRDIVRNAGRGELVLLFKRLLRQLSKAGVGVATVTSHAWVRFFAAKSIVTCTQQHVPITVWTQHSVAYADDTATWPLYKCPCLNFSGQASDSWRPSSWSTCGKFEARRISRSGKCIGRSRLGHKDKLRKNGHDHEISLNIGVEVKVGIMQCLVFQLWLNVKVELKPCAKTQIARAIVAWRARVERQPLAISNSRSDVWLIIREKYIVMIN